MRKNLKLYILSFSFTLCALSFTFNCYAKEITIFYTGDTHAMIYPCTCPQEPDGGIARRATLVKRLREGNSDTLLLDSGGFFASGLMDQYTQNTELDKARTLINLKAMQLMQYDAVAIGDDEFNFGRGFLEENINNHKTKLNLLSCNIKSDKFLPYVIREKAGVKIGIIGVTGLFAMPKAGNLEFNEPKVAVKKAVEELRNQGVDIIILLGHLGESEDIGLIKEIAGIDILITGHIREKNESFSKINSTLLLRPAWQGRSLGKLSLVVENNKLVNYKVEELRLSNEIPDDPDILQNILPQCFSDANCKKEGFIGVCKEPGSLDSRCVFNEAAKISLLIIEPKVCRTCNTKGVVDFLKRQLPGLTIDYIYYPHHDADIIIDDLGVKSLPIYLLGKQVEKESAFDNLKENIEAKGNFYMLKPQFTGIAYFVGRKEIKGRLDLFISLYGKNTAELLDRIKDFKPTIHFLAARQKDGIEAAGGDLEVEEYLRSVCVQKYYPQVFWDYISCRARNINSSWWQDCLDKLDTARVMTCARGEKGKLLLEKNINLNKELKIMFGPTYLLDNLEIFSTQGVPSKEELEKIIKR